MFRSTNSAGGGQGQPPLYSPAAASDSSGFSEHTSGAPPGGMFSPPGISSFCNPALRPHYESGGGGGVGHGGQGRSLSPQIPHTYHNPTLMASPYSTLPRKPGHRMGVNSKSKKFCLKKCKKLNEHFSEKKFFNQSSIYPNFCVL